MEGPTDDRHDIRCPCGWYCGRNKGYFHKLNLRSKIFTVKMVLSSFRIEFLKRWNLLKKKFFELVED